MSATPAQRDAETRSRSYAAAISVPNTIDVSRNAATRPIGASVIAQSTSP
jgi:hypothetical protein